MAGDPGGSGRPGSLATVVSEPLLAVLRVCVLALLYLFFLRVLRAVWVEVRPPSRKARAAGPVAGAPAVVPATAGTATATTGWPGAPAPAPAPAGPRLVVVEPETLRGQTFGLVDELTIGRAPGCHVTLDDGFVSQLHARVFRREGAYLVEDLGSTNGTYLNRQKVTAAVPLHPGDRLQVGGVVLECA